MTPEQHEWHIREGQLFARNIFNAANNPDDSSRHYVCFSLSKSDPQDVDAWASLGLPIIDIEIFADMIVKYCERIREGTNSFWEDEQ